MAEEPTCIHCGYWIHRAEDGTWVHNSTGLIPCLAETDASPRGSGE